LSDSQAESMTQTGQAMGTVLYMSPEQLRGEAVDARSDLWSLGVVAYEMLSGVSPFRTDSSAVTVGRILNDEPPPLPAVLGVPDWLAELVSQLRKKNPAERPRVLPKCSAVSTRRHSVLAVPILHRFSEARRGCDGKGNDPTSGKTGSPGMVRAPRSSDLCL